MTYLHNQQPANLSAVSIRILWLVAAITIPTLTLAQEDQTNTINTRTDANILNSRILELTEQWAADPLNEKTAHKLNQLRQQQDQFRTQTLEQLSRALQHYIDGHPYHAAQDFAAAQRSGYTENLANAILEKPLYTYQQFASRAADEANIKGLCPTCGDTRLKNCTHKKEPKYFGNIPCNTCNGGGIVQVSAQQARQTGQSTKPCPECLASGRSPCPDCHGTGLVPCDTCYINLMEFHSPSEQQAIHRLQNITSHLLRRGPDIYSPNVLQPTSPIQSR